MMKLYHGTNIDFSEIDFRKCKPNKDFGQGFYLTDIKKQALEMAVRAMMLWLDPLLTMVWFTNSTSTNNISLQQNSLSKVWNTES